MDYFVSPTGSDTSPGTLGQPFRTIQRAADLLGPGETCFVRAGTYRETIRPARAGTAGWPVRFVAYPGEAVTLSGTEEIPGPWRLERDAVYATTLPEGTPSITQLFLDGLTMVVARWPNCRPEELWDRTRWARASSGSRYGRIVDPALAATGIDWTGATAVLNVAHEFFTWTRPARAHAAGADVFEYDRDMGKDITRNAEYAGPWEDDRYYLVGSLEALDSPTEWHLDVASGTLSLWTEEGDSPASHAVEAKVRDYVFEAEGLAHVHLVGFRFFGATFRFERCDHCLVQDCDLRYPVFAPRLAELESPPRHSARTYMAGAYNTVRGCSIAFSSTSGLVMAGPYATVENNLIHDVCWSGSLFYSGVKTEYLAADLTDAPGALLVRSPVWDTGMEPQRAAERWEEGPPGALVRRNTVFNCGNTCIWTDGYPGAIVELNDVHDGGLQCKDASLLYTHLPVVNDTVFRFNWVHGNRSPSFGLGIRGDDQTHGLTIHHNVVWDVPDRGIVVKGDHIRVYHNTVFDCPTPIEVQRYAEPRKPWRNQWPLLDPQNPHSEVVNNAGRTVFRDTVAGAEDIERLGRWEDRVHHNVPFVSSHLVNPAALDFRPVPDSPLAGAGVPIPNLTPPGELHPDAGAYASDADQWVPGCRLERRAWLADPLPVPSSVPNPEAMSVPPAAPSGPPAGL